MKRIVKKLTSRKGETLVEILVAVLIVALAAGMFAALYFAAMNINLTAREEDEKFYDAVGTLENMIESGEGIEGTLHYEPTGEGADPSSRQDITVNVVTQEGMSVYNDGGK